MAEVISASGVPVAAAFGNAGFLRLGTALFVDTDTGDLYVLKSGDIVVKSGVGGGAIADETFWMGNTPSGGGLPGSASGVFSVFDDPVYWMGV